MMFLYESREQDIDTGKMEAVFHSKAGNKINLTKVYKTYFIKIK